MTSNRQTSAVFVILLLILVSGIIIYVKYGPSLEWPTPVPPTTTSTITPPPELGEAVVTGNTGCYDWSNKMLAEIEIFDQVKVLGRNKDGSWYMVRVPGLKAACWVKSDNLNPSDFSTDELFVISEPFPPPATPTTSPTYTLTSTSTPTTGSIHFFESFTSTSTATKTPKVKIPTSTHTPTSTGTVTSTNTSTNTPTITATATATSTSTSTPTFTPTSTPTNTPTPTSATCDRPAAPNLTLSARGQSKNVDLTWNSVIDVTNYEVFRSANGGGYSSLGRTNKTNMKDSLPNNGTYEYYVVAINSCGNSDHSNTERITR